MSEPITLYDKDGKELTVYGKAQAAALIAARQATAEKPVKVAKGKKDAAAEEAAEVTKEAAAAQAGKSKKTAK